MRAFEYLGRKFGGMGSNTTVDWSFEFATRESLDAVTSKREGETKLGEMLQIVDTDQWEEALQESEATYVLIGIPEDIGVRANLGVGGAHTLWEPFLKAFCNVQETQFVTGNDCILLGAFDVTKLMERSLDADLKGLREMTAIVDDAVYPYIQAIASTGKIPIVIGGGHNNCYPIIKGISEALGSAINSVNLDAHSDFRMAEGRHSGNGFRYAKEEGYLERYSVIGLHNNYNSQNILDELAEDENLNYSFYEDIFLNESLTFEEAIIDAATFTQENPTGLELDVDCIERTLSSAATPCGITPLQARKYLTTARNFVNLAYLHITEGATELRDGRTDSTTAKLVAYLVTDFLRKEVE